MHPGIIKCPEHGLSYDPKRNKGCPLCLRPGTNFEKPQVALLKRAAPLWLMSLLTLGAAYMVVTREPPKAAGADDESVEQGKAAADAGTASAASDPPPDGKPAQAPEATEAPKPAAKLAKVEPARPVQKQLREVDLVRELSTVEAILEDKPRSGKKAALVAGLLALSDAVRDRGAGESARKASDELYQAAAEIQTERPKPRAQWRRAKRAVKNLRKHYLDD